MKKQIESLLRDFQGIRTGRCLLFLPKTSVIGFSLLSLVLTSEPAAAFQISKTASPSGNVDAGDTITYTIAVTNSSGSTVNNVVVHDTLPTGVTYAAGTSMATYWVDSAIGSGSLTTNIAGASFDPPGLGQNFNTTGVIPAGSTLTSYGFSVNGFSSDWLSDLALQTLLPSGAVAYNLPAGTFGGNFAGNFIPNPTTRGPGAFGGTAVGVYQFNWTDGFNGVGGFDNTINGTTFSITYTYPTVGGRAVTNNAAGDPSSATFPNLISLTSPDPGSIRLLPGEAMTITFDVTVDTPLAAASFINTAQASGATAGPVSASVTNNVAPLMSACGGTTDFFAWDDGLGNGAVWNVDDASNTYLNVGGTGIDVTVELIDPDNQNLDTGNPGSSTIRTETTGVYGNDYLTFGMTSATDTQTVTLDFSFSSPVIMDSFEIGDMDYNGYGFQPTIEPGSSFQDELEVVAFNGTNPVTVSFTFPSTVSPLTVTNQTVYAPYTTGISGNLTPTDTNGQFLITSDGPITSLQIIYGNGPLDAAAESNAGEPAPHGESDDHAVRVDGFAFCEAPSPGLQLVKLADSAADGTTNTVASGSDVVYSYSIVNTGDTYLSSITVTDDVLGVVGTISGPLAPGATNTLFATNANVMAAVTNIGSATANPTDSIGRDLPGISDVSDADDAVTDVYPPPVITCPSDVTIECDASTAPGNTGTATATAACPGAVNVTSSDSSSAGSCVDESTITRVWTATDACGQSSMCTQTITVVDTTAPVITCPADVTVECDGDTSPTGTGNATATDNCDGTPSVSSADTVTAGACADEETISRVWTATDNCGNSSVCTQTITVVDTTAPVITCPADLTVECDGDTSPTGTGSATATDNCDGTPSVSSADTVTAGACADEETISRVWTATDNCGNSSVCTQTITVVDTTAPVITCPADVTVECDGDTSPTGTGSATATDNCDGTPSVSSADTVTAGACADEETISRVWTATDNCGNSSVCTQTITVVDTTAPVITCPADATVECDGDTSPTGTGSATATDNCDGTPFVSSADTVTAGACADEETISRVWTATDNCGNSSVCTQTITVVDTTAPVITCPADATVECDGDTSPTGTGSATATDNCDGTPSVSSADTVTAGACADEETISRVWTATDNCGNSSVCTQTITVVDTTAPVVSCPADVTVGCGGDTSVAANGTATATDNCDAAPSVSHVDATSSNVITRTWTATDACGNSSQCDQTITLTPCADVAVYKKESPEPVVAGEPIIYTIVVTNRGPDDATGVVMQEALPTLVDVTSFGVSQGSFDTNTQTWTVGILTNGGFAVLTITNTVDSSAP